MSNKGKGKSGPLGASAMLELLEPRLLLHASGTFLEGDYVHQWIAQQGYEFYSSQGQPGAAEIGQNLGTLPGSGTSWLWPVTPWHFFGTDIIEGTHEEDAVGVWYRHFVAGAEGDDLTKGLGYQVEDVVIDWVTLGIPARVLDPADWLLRYYSAYEAGCQEWNAAVADYPDAPASAYYHLGKVCHLLVDMTVPAHVHNERHAILEGPDPYEQAVAGKTTWGGYDDIYFLRYTKDRAVGPVREYSSLDALFRETADYTEDYDSRYADGEWPQVGSAAFDHTRLDCLQLTGRHLPQYVDKDDGFSGANLTVMAQDLMPFAIEQTAALYRLFAVSVGTNPGNHRPVLTEPHVTPLSGTSAQTYEFSIHYYDQDGDPPAIYNGRQYSELYLSNDRIETMHLVSGTAANGTYQVSVSGLSAGTYWHFFSFADSRGMSAMTPVYSGPYVSVAQGSDMSIRARSWTDPVPDGDNDSIPEYGERVGVDIKLTNNSGAQVTDVLGYLTSSLSSIQITDPNDNYGDISAGQDKWGNNDYHMFLGIPAATPVTFTLHVTYNKSGVPYYQDLTFGEDFHRVDNDVAAHHVVAYDPLPNGDADGIVESGESPQYDLYLTNLSGNGSIFARNVRARIVATNVGNMDGIWFDYPDLQGGGATPQKHIGTPINFASIPASFSGTVTADIEITWDGLSSPKLIRDYPFFIAQPDPWIKVNPGQWSFGVSGTTQDVVRTVTVANNGSEAMQVTAISPSHGDTTVTPSSALPWNIPAGESKTFDVTIETSGLQGQTIQRTVVVTSNGRLASGSSQDDRIVITGLVSDTPPRFEVPGAAPAEAIDVWGDIIVWTENRTGNWDIFAYDLSLGREFPICTAAGSQWWPKIGANVISWTDDRNGGQDIYAYYFPSGDLSVGEERVVSTDSAWESLVGADNGKVAFTRVYYVFGPNPWEGPSNLFLRDVAAGTTTQITSFVHSGTSTMGNVSRYPSDGDFGGGRIVWEQNDYVWNTGYPPYYWQPQNNSVQQRDPSGSISQVVAGYVWRVSTNDGHVAWVKDDAGGNAQVWVDGVKKTPGDTYYGDSNLAVGDGWVLYNRRSTELRGTRLADGTVSQIFPGWAYDPSLRMDNNLAAWVSGGKLYYTFLDQPDLSVTPADIAFSNASPLEGTSIDVTVTVHNLALIAAPGPVVVRLYDGDPDLPGWAQLGTDQTIPGGIPAQGSESRTFTGVPVGAEGIHHFYAKVFPAGGDNPGNNRTLKDLTVSDSDTQGPSIPQVTVAEYNGDEDGIIGADEQVRISWDLSDPSGIASTQLLVDGNPVTPVYGLSGGNPINANCYAILGPLTAGPHAYEIRATDADASPATSTRTGSFSVVAAEEITILLNASALADGQITAVDFGTVARGSPAVERIFFVRNDGEQALSLGAISVPAGFTVTAPASSVLAPGGSTWFTVTLQTGAPDTFSGQVTLANSDPDENPFNFPVTGQVVGLPTVVKVLVGGTSWGSSFLNYLPDQGLGTTEGYAVPVGSGVQLKPLPWTNIDQVKAVFNEDVLVDQTDLRLGGVNVASYGVDVFWYDAGTFTATWTLSAAIGADKLLIELNADGPDPIRDAAGNALDGEWTNPTSKSTPSSSVFPSGNGAAGGNFGFRVNVLPGDVNQNGVVQSNDGLMVRAALGTSTVSGGLYSVFKDINANSIIQANDGLAVRSRLGSPLPSGEPVSGMGGMSAPLSEAGGVPAPLSEAGESAQPTPTPSAVTSPAALPRRPIPTSNLSGPGASGTSTSAATSSLSGSGAFDVLAAASPVGGTPGAPSGILVETSTPISDSLYDLEGNRRGAGLIRSLIC